MQHCPRCTSDRVHSSRPRSTWEAWRKALTGKRPYRCRHCTWRGWAQDSGPHFSPDDIAAAMRAVAPDPPNLKDTELGRPRLRRDVDLRALDEAVPARQDFARQA